MARPRAPFIAWLAALPFAAGPASAQSLIVIDDGFTLFNPALWEPATNGPWQAGAPQQTGPTHVHGRDVLRIESHLSGPQRRGYLSTLSFPLRSALVEVDFSPISGDGAPLEVWLIFPFGDSFVAVSPYAPTPGQNLARVQSPGAVYTYGPPPLWTHGAWYRCVLDIRPRSVRASILTERGEAIWAHTYAWSLCSVAPEWGVGFVQYRESGEGTAVAAIDHFRVTLRCSADLNEDDRLTPADFIAFVAAWNSADCASDMDLDGARTVNDFMVFQTSFAAGCQ